MRRLFFVLSVFGLLVLAGVGSAAAESSTINFESYSAGNINGQNSWSKTGSYDVEVANVASFPAASAYGFQTKALRISNSFADGAFGGQAFAPPLTQAAGEGGINHFDASFDIGTALSTYQPGLINSFSPDNGLGGRMSYLRFEDQSDGIHVFFDDTTDAGPVGTVADFNETDIATLTRGVAHHVRFSINFVSGQANDVVKIYLDGALKITGTTWEDYYRFDPEQTGGGNLVPATTTMLFRAGGSSVPANAGNGWLIDNVTMSDTAQCTTTCYVDAVNGSDAFGGATSGDAKKTIQAAIDQVSSNGTVRVLPGHYQEEATNRSPSVIAGTYNFGLFVPASKSGVTVMGVTSGDVAISNAAATQADVTTVGDANFGPDGVFVEAANTTIQGLTINGNLDPGTLTESDNKTFEVFADGFTLKYSSTNVPGGGSVYFNDPSSAIASYHILNNQFLDGTSIDITGHTGTTGSVANREIKNNTFNLQGATYPGVSFNGSGTTVPWFDGQVGGATISGNSFTGSTVYIRSRGTVVDAEFAWGDWFNNNTFTTAVMTGPNPAGNSLTGYDYACGAYDCPNTKRIGATIQGEVDHSAANDIVLVKAGLYTENVLTTTSGLKFEGAQYGVSYNSRTFAGAAESTLNGQLGLQASGITVDGFSIKNHMAIDSTALGIYIKTAGSGASITNNMLGAILADFHGPQSHGLAIYLENGPDNVTIKNNQIDGVHGWVSSQAILVGDSTATDASTGVDIEDNSIKNITSDTRGAYGIQTNNHTGAGLTIKGNVLDTLTGSAVGGWVHAIAFEGPTTVADVEHNTIANLISPSANKIAVFFEFDGPFVSATVTRNNLDVGNDRYGVLNDVGSSTLNATCNWWGDSAGPNSTNGSDTGGAGTITAAPWLLSNDLNGACAAVTVNVAAADATNTPEGTPISINGSFNGSIASISADNGALGVFTPNAGAGTWTWTYTPNDNYLGTTINVTGHGTNGSTAVDTFSWSSTNVNPTAAGLTAPATQPYGVNFGISLNSPTDVSSVDAGSLHFAFDCGSGYSAANYGAASATNSASCPAPAQLHAHQSITVKGKVFDKDGGSNEYTASVEILQPEISLTPSPYDFGSIVAPGTSSPVTFTAKNIGTQTLTISGVALAGTNPSSFGIDTNNCDGVGATLIVNATCTIDLTFNPPTTGSKSARLEVTSNDPITAVAKSTLTGTGSTASSGSITINLDARPDGAQSFNFTGSFTAFSLSDPASNNLTHSGLAAGTYVVKAAKVNGWSLKTLTCNLPETIKKSKGKVTIHLTAGQNVTCTYTETQRLPDESIALTSGGPYSGVGIYSGTAQPSQTLNQAIAISQTKSFFVHLTNNSLDSDSFNVFSTLTGSTKFAVKFWNGATDITARVNAGTYNITLSAGNTITIRIDVRAVAGTPASATRNIDLTMKSKTSTSSDVVRGHVTRA
jgi:hypothetical protein